jgi:hypothetical protein
VDEIGAREGSQERLETRQLRLLPLGRIEDYLRLMSE